MPSDIYNTYSLNRIHEYWGCLVGESFRLSDPEFRKEVLHYSRQIMARVKENLEFILARLSQEGYRFVSPDEVYQPPDSKLLEWVEEYEKQGIYLPISLQAWLIEIGTVNLMGTHPAWPKTAYVFEEMTPTNDVLYTDPLVVNLTKDAIDFFYEEWQMRVEEEGEHAVGPFKIEIAPDVIHKAHVSGGLPYEIVVDSLTVDSILLNERRCTSFTHYIRTAIHWAGFPGFEYLSDEMQKYVADLQKALLPV